MLTDAERAWLLNAASTRPIWRRLQLAREAALDQVSAVVRVVPPEERQRAEFWRRVACRRIVGPSRLVRFARGAR